MAPQLALIVCFLFVVWLFAMDRNQGRRFSTAMWIPMVWFFIVATKSPDGWVSLLNGNPQEASDGNLSTFTYFALLASGFWVLSKRNVNWQSILRSNKWVFVFFSYIGLSIFWSDQPFSSLKLWIKDAGNLVMVLVLLTDSNPLETTKAFLVRSSFILITLSFLLVKYFPDLGRAYDVWTFKPVMIGAATDKNSLGASVLVCMLGLFWHFSDAWTQATVEKGRILRYSLVLGMALWLLVESHCATALACALIGGAALVLLRLPQIRLLVQRLGLSLFIVIPLLVLCLQMVFNIGDTFTKLLGRDPTLTSRTLIWQLCLHANINPFVGAGYCDFWHGDRAMAISNSLGFFYALKEAHDGYLETYLNVGWIGVFLLLVALLVGAARAMQKLATAYSGWDFRIVALAVGMAYNGTESAFSGLNPIWFVLLLVLMECPATENVSVREVLSSAETESKSCLGRIEEADLPAMVSSGCRPQPGSDRG